MPITKPGLAEEIVAPDEAAVIAEFIAFLKTASAQALSHRRRPPIQPGAPRRLRRGGVHGPTRSPSASRRSLRAAADYPACIRFANAASATDREKDVRGMSIQVRQVPGENLTPARRRRISS